MVSEATERRSVGIAVQRTKFVDMLVALARRMTRKTSASTVAKLIRMMTAGRWKRTKTNAQNGGANAKVQSRVHQQCSS